MFSSYVTDSILHISTVCYLASRFALQQRVLFNLRVTDFKSSSIVTLNSVTLLTAGKEELSLLVARLIIKYHLYT